MGEFGTGIIVGASIMLALIAIISATLNKSLLYRFEAKNKALKALRRAYDNLGDVYTSLDMYNEAVDAIEWEFEHGDS